MNISPLTMILLLVAALLAGHINFRKIELGCGNKAGFSKNCTS